MTIESIHFDEVLDMLGGDRQAVSALLKKFIDELASDVAASEQVLAEQDEDSLRQIAHWVKGTSANPGALMLSASRENWAACVEASEAVWPVKQRVMVGQARRVRDDIAVWIAAF